MSWRLLFEIVRALFFGFCLEVLAFFVGIALGHGLPEFITYTQWAGFKIAEGVQDQNWMIVVVVTVNTIIWSVIAFIVIRLWRLWTRWLATPIE